MKNHPYRNLPDSSFWKRSLANVAIANVDPVVKDELHILKTDKIATAGSCFAQHISHYLSKSGYTYFVTENRHPIIPEHLAAKYNYGTFTARYGNLYTTKQLLQLYKRVYHTFTPKENFWKSLDGNYFIDPFRPQIQPNGFHTLQELELDRKQHFLNVRKAFENLDYFVYTLGLTEAWVSNEDGAVYPICPGVAGGTFDESKYSFKNFTVEEVTNDMLEFIDLLRSVNPKAKLIITVSPVPLIATYEKKHVLVSTTYSKSVLIVSCEQIAKSRKNVTYFPSFEIITGNYTKGKYFGADLRSVTEEGVNHVMKLFMKHYTDFDATEKVADVVTQTKDTYIQEMEKIVEVMCDEEILDNKNEGK